MKIVQSAGTSVIASTATARQGERLGVGQRVEHLPLDPAQREDGQERQQHDRHREDDRPADGQAGRQDDRRGRRPRTGRPPKCSRSRCMTFSAITTDESTSTPIEIAMPASDMALAWMSTMPSRRKIAMIRNDESAASGSVLAMTSDVRTCSRTTSTHSEAEIIASTTVPVTVPIAPSISGVRS